MSDEEAARSSLMKEIEKYSYRTDTCFLCGGSLDRHTRSDEHMFPRWLLHRHNLWDQELTLLNMTSIPYRQLMIPACSECNSSFLAPLEERIRLAVEQGADGVRQLGKPDLFYWLAKIFYGILFREVTLRHDRKAPGSGPIVPPEIIEGMRLHHMLMQGVRRSFSFVSGFPASIFVFSVIPDDQQGGGFDFHDSIAAMFISIRMGPVAIIAALQDGGALTHAYPKLIERYGGFALDHAQYREMIARLMYARSLLRKKPLFMISEGNGQVQVVVTPPSGKVLDEWDQSSYVHFLSFYLGGKPEDLWDGHDRVLSWLTDENGIVKKPSPPAQGEQPEEAPEAEPRA